MSEDRLDETAEHVVGVESVRANAVLEWLDDGG